MKMDSSKYTFDIIGNRILRSTGNGLKLMLIAHADKVAMMITYVNDQGFINVKPVGGIDVSILPSHCVCIKHGGKDIIGVVGKRPFHLQRSENDAKLTWDDIWIDIGATSKEEALQIVSIGDYVHFCSKSTNLANDLITGKGLDDSCGLQVLHKVAEELPDKEVNYDIYFVESNFEEIGMRGAQVAANAIKPDICIAIDVTHATDFPGMNPVKDGDIKVGRGCVLTIGPNIDKDLFSQLKEIADDCNISYQIEPCPYPTGTDANVVQISGNGVRTAVISIPCRYMHTPQEVCSKKDIESAIKIIGKFVQL